MTDVATTSVTAAEPPSTDAETTAPRLNRILAHGIKLEPLPQTVENLRARLQNTAVFSPVNQNGSFDFDRVIKSGQVLKRTRKTKNWKAVHVVLRPNVISLYKDKDQTKLRHQINLSELTAVARQRDPKGKVQHAFVLFSPSRNFHLAATTDNEAHDWVEAIRNEARIDNEEEEMVLANPKGVRKSDSRKLDCQADGGREVIASSSSEAEYGQRPTSAIPSKGMHSARRASHSVTYSGNEYGSFSDFSDSAPPGGFRSSAVSLSATPNPHTSQQLAAADFVYGLNRPRATRNTSQLSSLGMETGGERVVCHGWLHILKSKGGVRQWKKLWVVLRPKTLALYKNAEEYSANLIIPFASILNAVEIDPISKSKRYCLQIITEERNYRFSAVDEDNLAKWLGALKSILAKRKEVGKDHEREIDQAVEHEASQGDDV